MATRNINSFIEHLMNEAMTTSTTYGYPTDRSNPRNPYDNPPNLIPYTDDTGYHVRDKENNPLYQSPIRGYTRPRKPTGPGKPPRGRDRERTTPPGFSPPTTVPFGKP
jgi:hypothetical protein